MASLAFPKNDNFKMKQRYSVFQHKALMVPKAVSLVWTSHSSSLILKLQLHVHLDAYSLALSKCPIGLDLLHRLPTSNYQLLFHMPYESTFSLYFTAHSHLFLHNTRTWILNTSLLNLLHSSLFSI